MTGTLRGGAEQQQMPDPDPEGAPTGEAQCWAVVGGGMLGMTLAHRLRREGHRVTLYEAAPDLGGLASAWKLEVPGEEPIVWDRHYHVTLLSDGRVRALLGELGLDDQMQWVETRTGCYTDGNLYSVSNSLEFLRLSLIHI